MTEFRRLTVVLLPLLCLVGPAIAQIAEPPLAPLRAKDTLTEEDRKALRTWMSERVNAITSGDVLAGQTAVNQVRQVVEAESTTGFSEAFETVAITAVRGSYRNAELRQAAQLVGLLNLVNATDASAVFVEALQDQRAAVRAAAAAGIRNIRAKLAQAGGDYITRSVNALREAGTRETSTETLRLIYLALDFSDLPAASAAKEGFLAVMDARARQYANPESVRGAFADSTAMKVGERYLPRMSDGERQRFARAAARMLRYGVQRYTGADGLGKLSPDVQSSRLRTQRKSIERLITHAEDALVKAMAPQDPPAVREQMQQAQLVNMRIGMNEWAKIVREPLGIDVALESGEGE